MKPDTRCASESASLKRIASCNSALQEALLEVLAEMGVSEFRHRYSVPPSLTSLESALPKKPGRGGILLTSSEEITEQTQDLKAETPHFHWTHESCNEYE